MSNPVTEATNSFRRIGDKYMQGTQGSVEEFKANWQRPEAEYCHFTRGEPENQIQFAFRQNWLEFAKIMEPLKPWTGKRSLEVGAGRGTMSMYFADNGFDVTLLDACEKPLEQARKQFSRHGLKCHCHVGDAMKLPFDDESFDVVHSYGLMEHFDKEHLGAAIDEQIRVVAKGGLWIAYVVAYEANCGWPGMSAINEAIRIYANAHAIEKQDVFRNQVNHDYYNSYSRAYNSLSDKGDEYVYPFPIIGPSAEFPFTLNRPDVEMAIVREFTKEMESKARRTWAVFDPREEPCQAGIVWGWKR